MNFWDERYSNEEYAYGIMPNEFFREEISKITPGKILLPGEGEGRNAVFASKLGWNVVAFDQSVEAKRKALKLAEQHSVPIYYSNTNYLEFKGNHNSFDFIALIFTHMPPDTRKKFHSYLIELMKPGAKIIIEAFSKEQLNYNSGGPKNPELLYTKTDLINDFNSLKDVEVKKLVVTLNEGVFHQGKASVIRLIGKK